VLSPLAWSAGAALPVSQWQCRRFVSGEPRESARIVAQLSADIRKRIDGKLTIYATNGSGDVKRLKGPYGCRLRIGDWRVVFIEEARSITVIAVGNRGEIYD
jgi:mRNA interferase RelE/StbE